APLEQGLLVHLGPQRFHAIGIRPYKQRRKELFDGSGEHAAARAAHITKSDTLCPVAGAHLYQARVPGGDGRVRKRSDFVERYRWSAGFDGFNDRHGKSSSGVTENQGYTQMNTFLAMGDNRAIIFSCVQKEWKVYFRRGNNPF